MSGGAGTPAGRSVMTPGSARRGPPTTRSAGTDGAGVGVGCAPKHRLLTTLPSAFVTTAPGSRGAAVARRGSAGVVRVTGVRPTGHPAFGFPVAVVAAGTTATGPPAGATEPSAGAVTEASAGAVTPSAVTTAPAATARARVRGSGTGVTRLPSWLGRSQSRYAARRGIPGSSGRPHESPRPAPGTTRGDGAQRPRRSAPRRSRLRVLMTSSGISLGQASAQAPVLVQPPKPSWSCWATILTTRA